MRDRTRTGAERRIIYMVKNVIDMVYMGRRLDMKKYNIPPYGEWIS